MIPVSAAVSIRGGVSHWVGVPETLAVPRKALAGRYEGRTCAFGTSRTAPLHPRRRSNRGSAIGPPTPFASAQVRGRGFHHRSPWQRLLPRATFAENCWAGGGQ